MRRGLFYCRLSNQHVNVKVFSEWRFLVSLFVSKKSEKWSLWIFFYDVSLCCDILDFDFFWFWWILNRLCELDHLEPGRRWRILTKDEIFHLRENEPDVEFSEIVLGRKNASESVWVVEFWRELIVCVSIDADWFTKNVYFYL